MQKLLYNRTLVEKEVTTMITQNKTRQMSEAFITSVFLALSGGFQDAYTFFVRDKVFSNAQTGNVVLLSTHMMQGEYRQGIKYLFPILAFALGIFIAERISAKYKHSKKIHWRQMVLLFEIIILTGAVSYTHLTLPTKRIV